MAQSPLEALHTLRGQYTPAACRALLSALATLAVRPMRSARALARFHDDLLFLAAFPNHREIADAAATALAGFARRVRAARLRHRLEGTGIAGTMTRAVLSATMVRDLAHRYPASLDLDRAVLGAGDTLAPLLRLTLLHAEEDGFEAPNLSTRTWMARAGAEHAPTLLEWLLRQRPAARAPAASWDAAFDEAEPPVAWRLPSPASASQLRLPFAPTAFRAGHGFRRPPTPRMLTRPLATITHLDPDRAMEAIHVARVALAVRGREVHAITEANAEEVYLADLGLGVALVLIGAARHARMSLEANYGYLLLANQIPIGYGGVTPLSHQANTGINIFPAFRGSEAAAIFAETLRAFHTLFQVRRFVVNPYQFGRANPEAIASGAYWFYHRLGFAATDHALRALAAREHTRLRQQPDHRTDRVTLRRLAAGDLTLALPGAGRHPLLEERLLAEGSLAATAAIGRAAGAQSRVRARRRITRETARRLGAGGWSRWPRPERDAFMDLAPIVSLLPLERWTPAERRALIRWVRAKGGAQERAFVQAGQGIARFWRDLRRACAGAR